MLTGGWWMYYVENYFPLMYAILEAEMAVSKQKVNKQYLTEIKQKIKEEYEKFKENNKTNLLFIEEDINHLMQIDMTYEYKAVLFRNVWLIGEEINNITNQLCLFVDKLIETYK